MNSLPVGLRAMQFSSLLDLALVSKQAHGSWLLQGSAAAATESPSCLTGHHHIAERSGPGRHGLCGAEPAPSPSVDCGHDPM